MNEPYVTAHTNMTEIYLINTRPAGGVSSLRDHMTRSQPMHIKSYILIPGNLHTSSNIFVCGKEFKRIQKFLYFCFTPTSQGSTVLTERTVTVLARDDPMRLIKVSPASSGSCLEG